MSTYDERFESPFEPPFESWRDPACGCICGRHRSEAEHAFEARRTLQCVPVEDAAQTAIARYRGVIASAAMRARPPRLR